MRVLSYFAVLIAAMITMTASAPAFAQPAMIALNEPCILDGTTAGRPKDLLNSKNRFDCRQGAASRDLSAAWALFSDIHIPPIEQDRWIFRHRSLRAEQEKIWFRFDDGVILPSLTKPHESVQILSSADVIHHVPAYPAAVDAILMRVDGFQNAHGIAPDAHIESASSLAARMGGFRLFYGLFIGMLFATLVYTLMVHTVLRHRFLLAYASFTASMMLFGLSWGGGLVGQLGYLSTLGQVRLNFVAVSLAVATATWFLTSFIEPEMLSSRIRQRLLALSLAPLALALARNINFDWQWRAVDAILLSGLAATIITIYVTALVVMRKGSIGARLFVIGWTLPALVAIVRMGWAIGLINWNSAIFDVSIFIAIMLVVVVMTAGVAWRIRELQADRDESRARELALISLANSDPLTGLLDRRAFIDRAMDGDCGKRLILLRIERFRSLNERYGHMVGDDVLMALARCLRASTGRDALIGRLSGAEFAIVVDASENGQTIRAIRKRLAGTAFPLAISVPINIGTALGQIVDALSWKAVYSAADRSLQASRVAVRKRKGREDMAIAA